MSIAAIQQWLSSPTRSYAEGVKLFSQHSNSAFLKHLLGKSEDDYNFSRLMRELQSIVDAPAEPVVKATEAPPVYESDAAPADPGPVIPEEYTKYRQQQNKVDVSKLPTELQAMVAEKGELYRKCSHIHSKLMHYETDLERSKEAERLVTMYRRIQEIWLELDYFEEYKIVRPKSGVDIAKLTPIQLLKHRNNVRTRVSRYRKDKQSELYLAAVAELEAVNLLIAKNEEDE